MIGNRMNQKKKLIEPALPVDDSQTKVAASERQPLGIKQIRRLSDVLAATRKRQKRHPLKSHAEAQLRAAGYRLGAPAQLEPAQALPRPQFRAEPGHRRVFRGFRHGWPQSARAAAYRRSGKSQSVIAALVSCWERAQAERTEYSGLNTTTSLPSSPGSLKTIMVRLIPQH